MFLLSWILLLSPMNGFIVDRHSSIRNQYPSRPYPPFMIRNEQSKLDNDVSTDERKQNRKKPKNSKAAIRWVVESISKVMDTECKTLESSNGKKKRPNFRLLEALTELIKATDQSAIIHAGKKIEALNITLTESYDVQERVIRATAMVGLVQLSTNLLESMITEENCDSMQLRYTNQNDNQMNKIYIPSEMAYSAVLTCLRKMGKISKMRNLFDNVVTACKKQKIKVDLVAFNIFLSGLCDALLESYKNNSNQFSTSENDDNDTNNINQNQISDLLAEVVYLLHPGVAEERFFLNEKPNILSFNTVLAVTARLGDQNIVSELYDLLISQDIIPDIYTYNARIRASKYNSTNSPYPEVLTLLDELMKHPEIEPDQYTIELVLVPLARAGRIGDILNLIGNFQVSESSKHRGRQNLSNAFSTFLITLVKANEIEIAQAIFDTFIMTERKSSIIMVDDKVIQSTTDKKISGQASIPPITRHFNVLIEGYRSIHEEDAFKKYTKSNTSDSSSSGKISNACSSARKRAMDIYQLMQNLGIHPDAYTITSILGLLQSPEEINAIWKQTLPDNNIKVTAVIYNAIITAYGTVNDPNSACYIFDMMLNDKYVGNTKNSWSVLLLSLSRVSDSSLIIETRSSNATLDETEELESSTAFIGSVVNGLSVADASLKILDVMRDPTKFSVCSPLKNVPLPTSQSYCAVASTLSRRDIPMKEKDVKELFQNALNDGVPADGRFLNALIRCYGDQIEDAINFWKSGVRIAAVSHETRKNRPRSRKNNGEKKKGKNLMAAYHGLFYVAGRAERPDIALRLVYAMIKEGLEPTETALNSYKNGKRVRANIKTDKPKNFFVRRLTKQYESLLTIECTKYDQRDQRRQNEKRLRIIIR